MKRSIVIKFKDGTEKELELSKATGVKVEKGFINLEELKDGTWRLVWNELLIPDFSQVVSWVVKREGDPPTREEAREEAKRHKEMLKRFDQTEEDQLNWFCRGCGEEFGPDEKAIYRGEYCDTCTAQIGIY